MRRNSRCNPDHGQREEQFSYLPLGSQVVQHILNILQLVNFHFSLLATLPEEWKRYVQVHVHMWKYMYMCMAHYSLRKSRKERKATQTNNTQKAMNIHVHVHVH